VGAQVRFVDTSILLELLRVPGKAQQPEQVRAELDELLEARVQLVLPVATVIETGNHIAQLADGAARRRCAEAFVALLRATIEGRGVPWVPHAVAWDGRMLGKLCDGARMTGSFVDLATAGDLGTGDLAILAECELFEERTSGVEVKVWTHDQRLKAYAG
jgi:hypothetical protein